MGPNSPKWVPKGENHHASLLFGPEQIDACNLARCEQQVNHQLRELQQRQRIWGHIQARDADLLARLWKDVEESQRIVAEDCHMVERDRE